MIRCWQQISKKIFILKSFNLLLFAIGFIVLVANGCKNSDSDLGLNLRSDKGEFYSAESDTFTINAYTVNEDALKTDSLSTNILGAMNDPNFGISTASIASQITIGQLDLSFGIAPKIDSVILYLRWDKIYYYGNLNSKQNLKIFYLDEMIENKNKYFSNHPIPLGAEIGDWNGTFNLTDSVSVKIGNKIIKKAPGLLIKISKSFGENLANASPNVYSSVEAFKTFLKGIVVVPQKNLLASGDGAIAGVDFFTGNSQILVNYNDTMQHSFVFNNNCDNYNTYNNIHTNPDLLNQLQHPGLHYNTTYVQSMGGCKTKIEIPYLLNLVKGLKNERLIINEAALILTPLNGTVSSNYTLPSRLYLFQPDTSTNKNTTIVDFIDYLKVGTGVFSLYGGGYNSLTGEYTIRFTRHLQNLLDQYIVNGQNLNRGFYVTIPSDKPITPTRLILNNTRTPNYKALKFRVTYSKLKI